MAGRTYKIFKRSFAGSDKRVFKYQRLYLICVQDNNSDLTIRKKYHRYVQPRGITGFLDGLNINQDIIINNRLLESYIMDYLIFISDISDEHYFILFVMKNNVHNYCYFYLFFLEQHIIMFQYIDIISFFYQIQWYRYDENTFNDYNT